MSTKKERLLRKPILRTKKNCFLWPSLFTPKSCNKSRKIKRELKTPNQTLIMRSNADTSKKEPMLQQAKNPSPKTKKNFVTHESIKIKNQ